MPEPCLPLHLGAKRDILEVLSNRIMRPHGLLSEKPSPNGVDQPGLVLLRLRDPVCICHSSVIGWLPLKGSCRSSFVTALLDRSADAHGTSLFGYAADSSREGIS